MSFRVRKKVAKYCYITNDVSSFQIFSVHVDRTQYLFQNIFLSIGSCSLETYLKYIAVSLKWSIPLFLSCHCNYCLYPFLSVTVPKFTQQPLSYLSLPTLTKEPLNFSVEIVFAPELANGLILYNDQLIKGSVGDFISFGMSDGFAEFRYVTLSYKLVDFKESLMTFRINLAFNQIVAVLVYLVTCHCRLLLRSK